MKLTSLKIENHSRFADTALEVREHLVLVGATDVGKTSFLRCVNVALGLSNAQILHGLSSEDLRDTTTPLVVEATFNDFTDDERAHFPDEISVVHETGQESLTLRVEISTLPEDSAELHLKRWFPESGRERQVTREQLAAIGWHYLPANRVAVGDQFEGKTSSLRTMLESVELGAGEVELVELLAGFNSALANHERLTELRHVLAEHLTRAMPRVVDHENLAVRTTSDPERNILQEVTLMFVEGDGYRGLAEQSDGIRQLMSMTFFDLARQAANIVAIDEPELHLHPTSQRTVANIFRRSTNQKIISTHSPYVLQRFEPKHIVVVTPSRQFKQLKRVEFSRFEKMYALWWSAALLQALAARHVVLVEGASDRIILEAAAAQLSLDLDRLGIAVLDLDGADKFKYINRIIGSKGLGASVLGLVDEDHESAWAGELGIAPKKLDGQNVFVSRPDLEGEYCKALGPTRTLAAFTQEGAAFRERQVLDSCGVQSSSELTAEALAQFARGRKTDSAIAVAASLTKQEAESVISVFAILQRAASL